jgi:hypothetical protein
MILKVEIKNGYCYFCGAEDPLEHEIMSAGFTVKRDICYACFDYRTKTGKSLLYDEEEPKKPRKKRMSLRFTRFDD